MVVDALVASLGANDWGAPDGILSSGEVGMRPVARDLSTTVRRKWRSGRSRRERERDDAKNSIISVRGIQ